MTWGLHFCPLDADCRDAERGFGGPTWRLYVHTPWGSLIIAFRWRDRTQLWLPWKTRGLRGTRSNYTRWWSPVVWHPKG